MYAVTIYRELWSCHPGKEPEAGHTLNCLGSGVLTCMATRDLSYVNT